MHGCEQTIGLWHSALSVLNYKYNRAALKHEKTCYTFGALLSLVLQVLSFPLLKPCMDERRAPLAPDPPDGGGGGGGGPLSLGGGGGGGGGGFAGGGAVVDDDFLAV